jgi:iron complex transport system ATP-binding protein
MIKATSLTYRLGPKSLLQNVSLSARPGEVLGIIGANGAGKSTLLKLLSSDLKPSAGEVIFEGKKLAQWPAAALARRRAVLTQQHAGARL